MVTLLDVRNAIKAIQSRNERLTLFAVKKEVKSGSENVREYTRIVEKELGITIIARKGNRAAVEDSIKWAKETLIDRGMEVTPESVQKFLHTSTPLLTIRKVLDGYSHVVTLEQVRNAVDDMRERGVHLTLRGVQDAVGSQSVQVREHVRAVEQELGVNIINRQFTFVESVKWAVELLKGKEEIVTPAAVRRALGGDPLYDPSLLQIRAILDSMQKEAPEDKITVSADKIIDAIIGVEETASAVEKQQVTMDVTVMDSEELWAWLAIISEELKRRKN